MKYDLCVIGGAGRVGLPLGVAFANAGVRTVLFDINHAAIAQIQSGRFPFMEKNGNRELKKALAKRTLSTAAAPDVIGRSGFILLVVGTPVDEYLNPDIHGITSVIDQYLPHFRRGQILILRSTVYPGTSERIQRYLLERGKLARVAFCPERIAQGRALEEIRKLPQIVSAFDRPTLDKVSQLFKRLTANEIIPLARPVEAELAKLFSNSWRYIKFAVANQFFMIAADHELDYHRIYTAMTRGYPRNADLPSPGFAAGPCLLKDTMQLAAFHNNNFFVGHAAMLVNEGLPNFMMRRLKRSLTSSLPQARRPGRPEARLAGQNQLEELMARASAAGGLKSKTVGILGMAFKGNSDDPRDSLAYKLKKLAQTEARTVLCHDVYIKDASFHPLGKVIKESDIVILAAPHREYKTIDPKRYPGKHFVDIWGFWEKKL